MTTPISIATYGKVEEFPYGTNPNRILCDYDEAKGFVWQGNLVYTSGSRASTCNIVTHIFNVTVDQATADLLTKGYVFILEYDPRVHNPERPNERLVTSFAGYPIHSGSSPGVSAGAAAGVIASASPSAPPGGSPSSAPPQ